MEGKGIRRTVEMGTRDGARADHRANETWSERANELASE